MGLPASHAPVDQGQALNPSGEGTPGTIASSSTSAEIELTGEPVRSFPSTADQLFVTGFAATNLLLARLFLCAGAFGPLPASLTVFWGILSTILGALTLIFCLPPLLAQVYRELLEVKFSIDLAKVVVMGCLGVATVVALFIEPSAFQQEFFADSLVVVCFLLVLEQWLFERFSTRVDEQSVFDVAKSSGLQRKLEPYPDHAPVEVEVAPHVIKVGELFRVGAGRMIACDGTIAEGQAEIAERRLSGAAVTKFKSRGNKVYAGSTVLRGDILCEATALTSDSLLTSFTDNLSKRIEGEWQSPLISSTWESRVCLGVLVLALAAGAYFFGMGEGISRAAHVAAAMTALCLLLRCSELLMSANALALAAAFWRGVAPRRAADLFALKHIRSLIFDYVSPFLHQHLFVKEFQMIDERIERDGLISVVLCMLGASDDQRDEAITEYMRRLVDTPVLHKVSDLRFYEGRGTSAVVNGVDFSLGVEGFLVERGVYFQSSDVVKTDDAEECLYVAMGDEVVAYLVLNTRAMEDPGNFVSRLRSWGLDVSLCSSEGPEQVDRAGKLLGLELTQVHSELPPERYIERLRQQPPTALVLDAATDPTLTKEADITLAAFDELRWDFEKAQVMLLRRDVPAIIDAFSCGYHAVLLRRLTMALLLVAPLMGIAGALFGIISVGFSVGVMVGALGLAYAVVLGIFGNSRGS